MSKYILIIFLSFGIVLSINAQEETQEEIKERKVSFLIDPITLPIEFIINSSHYIKYNSFNDIYTWKFGFEFQYAINKHFHISLAPSVEMQGNLAYYDVFGKEVFFDSYIYTVTPGFLFFPFIYNTKIQYVFIGLYPLAGLRHIITDISKDNLLNTGFFILSGQKIVGKNGFTLSYGFGIGETWSIPLDGNKYVYKQNHTLNFPFDIIINYMIGYSY
jgi:hypothetical protein